MTTELQLLVSGILMGGVYALMAVGLSLIFGVMGIINVAQGAFAVFAAYIAYWMNRLLGLDPLLTIVIVLPIVVLVGYMVQRFLLRQVATSHELATLLIMFGVAIVLENSMLAAWTGDFRSISSWYSTVVLSVKGVYISVAKLIASALAGCVFMGLIVFLRKAAMGKAIRATAQHRALAVTLGIDVERVSDWVFIIGIACAAMGGTLLGILYAFNPPSHWQWIGKLFAIVVLGGLGSIGGTLLGAIVLGITESFVAYYATGMWAEIVAYVVIIGVLFIRPSGLFGFRLR